jgi:hypothetical protein
VVASDDHGVYGPRGWPSSSRRRRRCCPVVARPPPARPRIHGDPKLIRAVVPAVQVGLASSRRPCLVSGGGGDHGRPPGAARRASPVSGLMPLRVSRAAATWNRPSPLARLLLAPVVLAPISSCLAMLPLRACLICCCLAECFSC